MSADWAEEARGVLEAWQLRHPHYKAFGKSTRRCLVRSTWRGAMQRQRTHEKRRSDIGF